MTRLAALLLVALALWPQAAPGQTQPVRVHHDLRVTLEPQHGKVVIDEELRVIGAASAVLTLPEGFAMNRMKIEGPGSTLKSKDGVWRLGFKGAAEHRMTLTYRGPLATFDEAARGAAFAGTQGSYLPSRGGWYPDFGAELFTYTLEVDVPEDQRAVAPGRLVRETVADGRYRARFAVDWPAEDVVVMAGPYEIGERRHGDIRLRTYFHPEVAALSDAYLEKSGEYLDRYEAAIGDYPFPAFHVVSSPRPVGLGYPGLAYIGRRVLRLPFILETSLGHEVLHNWWGNGVYVDYAAGNWAEGLTTFMADYAFAEAKGEETARAMRLRWLNDYATVPTERDEPLSAFTGPNHGAARVTGYAKSAMLFVMLQGEIGAEAFDAGIRRLWLRYRFRRAAWADLQRAFEHASGRDLGRFFGQWIEQAGAPVLKLKSVKTAAAAGGHRVSFTLIQDAPAYALKVPVTVETEDGARRFQVSFIDRIERYALDVDARPLAVEIDPDGRLFRRLGRGEVPAILRSVFLAPKVIMSVASDDDDFRAAAEALAAGLVEGEVEVVDRFAALLFNQPLILVGSGLSLGRLVAAAGLVGTPVDIMERGEARVWTGMGGRGYPALVIEAESAAMLAELAARLPHYGAKSYLLFEDGEVTVSGTWEPIEKLLRFEFP